MVREWPVQSIMECISTEKYSTQIGPFGSALKVEDYRPTGVPLLRGVNVNRGRFHDDDFVFIDPEVATTLHKYKAGPGDVILVHRGTLGKIGLIPREPRFPSYIMGNSMLRIRCDAEKLLPEFLYYWLTSTEGQHFISSRAVQVGVPALPTPLKTLRELSLPVPSVVEQKQIVEALGALDDKIELNRRMNATLEAMAQAVFKEWFVDGAKAEWDETTVGDEFDIVMGQSPPGDTYNEGGEGVPFFQGRTDFGFRFPTPRVYCTAPTRLAKKGDTLVSVRAPVGSVNMAEHDCAIGRGVAAIRHKSGARSYTYHLMHSLEPQFELFEAGGTVFGSMNKKDFHGIKIQQPSPDRIDAFESLVGAFDERVSNNEAESRTLAALRDTLLPKLMRGEVRVKEKSTVPTSV